MGLSYVEKRYTRDFITPRVAGDDELVYGFKCIPQQPTNDDDWVVCDTSKDYKTGWMRVVYLDR
jgi:hypothetical protein